MQFETSAVSIAPPLLRNPHKACFTSLGTAAVLVASKQQRAEGAGGGTYWYVHVRIVS